MTWGEQFLVDWGRLKTLYSSSHLVGPEPWEIIETMFRIWYFRDWDVGPGWLSNAETFETGLLHIEAIKQLKSREDQKEQISKRFKFLFIYEDRMFDQKSYSGAYKEWQRLIEPYRRLK